ncbi:GNAT family N-acetyltransferase [candidate division GN15 bacterium]|nr:GNAT family N-acetyltransferase [candidate division GN15 bacterium]
MPMLPTIDGVTIRLRQLKRSDAASFAHNANDRQVTRYLHLPHPYTLLDAQQWVKQTHSLARRKRMYAFGIEHKESRQVIGMVGLHHIDRANRLCELGYWIGRTYWRRGYTSEAIRLILPFAFDYLRMQRVQARVFHPNTASGKLLEKLGFTYEGCWRRAEYVHGRWFDVRWYAILKKEFSRR